MSEFDFIDDRRGASLRWGFSDPGMDRQFKRLLGAVEFGGASPGECLAVASRISDGDYGAWTREFADMGEAVETDGDERLEKGHEVSSRSRFLRACSYYRAAEYFADPRGDLRTELGLRSREAFMKAAVLFPGVFEELKIPYGDAFMPGYFFSFSERVDRTIIILNGLDGTAEESLFHAGLAGLERGYNVMLVDGPGQAGMSRIFPKICFRPDYEVPIRAMVDCALEIPEVDPNRLALYGIGFGGYLALRGAAFDDRIRALAANSPIPDWYEYMASILGDDVISSPDDVRIDEIFRISDEKISPFHKMAVCDMCLRFGRKSLKSLFEYFREFRLGDLLGNIGCPGLAMVGEDEGEQIKRLARNFCDGISGKASFCDLPRGMGAGNHCQTSNRSFSCAVLYDWLDDILEGVTLHAE